MKLAGIDYSYTSPAICVHDTDKELTFENIRFYNFYADSRKKKLNGVFGANNIFIDNHPDYLSQEHRFANICLWAQSVLHKEGVEKVCLEGYSLGATSGLVFNIAENTSLLKQYMWNQKISFETPTPSQVKKNFTGKGNSKKDAMVDEFHRRFPHIQLHTILGVKEMSKPIDDIVDSFAILLCHEYYKEA